MITRIDITEALARLTATAPDKTPNPGESTLAAWSAYFDRHLDWTGDDLIAAVIMLNDRPRERMVQPADLGTIVTQLRRDAYERMDPDERETAWSDLGGGTPRQLTFGGGYLDATGQRRDRYGFIDKSAPELMPEPLECEHPTGDPCADPGCDKPSTFAEFCAKHYVLAGLSKLIGRVDVP
jgi:hypothetical protein